MVSGVVVQQQQQLSIEILTNLSIITSIVIIARAGNIINLLFLNKRQEVGQKVHIAIV